MFDEFWAKYPKKIAKKYAEQCFNRLSEANQKLAILGLDQYLKYWIVKGTSIDFIMHASTFINQERWSDELDLGEVNTGNWWQSDASTMGKGREVGIMPRVGEDMTNYRERIKRKLQDAA